MGKTYYTLVSKRVECPMWKDTILITAKYQYMNDSDNPYLVRFVNAQCEVRENARQPQKKRDRRLSLYSFCNIHDCPHLQDFPKIIDARLNHREN